MARPVFEALRLRFVDVVYVVDAAPGTGDLDVLAWAANERRTLITEDYDFGELAFRSRIEAEAIVIIGAGVVGADLVKDAKHAVQRLVELGDRLRGQLTILEVGRTRQRSLLART